MKFNIYLIIGFMYVGAYCQNAVVDSAAVMFKAKLLTVSEYGVAPEAVILKDIENQEAKFLKTKYKNFMFIRVNFSQPYRLGDSQRTLIRDCKYYIAYNVVSNRFYRLGGFGLDEIDDFVKDLNGADEEMILDWANEDEIEDIDIICLLEYAGLGKKKRLKRKFSCFGNCVDNTKLFYREH